MTFTTLLASIILAHASTMEYPPERPLPTDQAPHEEMQDEGEVADRSSKNSQEYNLYDREQNRNSRDDRGQYYYYQYDRNNGSNRGSQKLYQRDDG